MNEHEDKFYGEKLFIWKFKIPCTSDFKISKLFREWFLVILVCSFVFVLKVLSHELCPYNGIYIIYTQVYCRRGHWVLSSVTLTALRPGVSLNWKLAILARLANQWAPGIYLFLCWGYWYMQPCLAFCVDTGDVNLGSICIYSEYSYLLWSQAPNYFLW